MEPKEPTRVITVRMPESLHQRLSQQSYETKLSMNQIALELFDQHLPEIARVPNPDSHLPAGNGQHS